MAPPIGRIYHKNYNIAGNKFTVQVCYQGHIPSGRLAQEKDTWLYNLLVNNTVVEMGPWYDLQDRHPSNEEACDGLAQFWHDSQKIKDSQVLGDEANHTALQEIVERCAQKMFNYFLAVKPFDYEIIHAYMDENGWDVLLQPNVNFEGRKQMVLHFQKFPTHKGIWIKTYELERSVYTDF